MALVSRTEGCKSTQASKLRLRAPANAVKMTLRQQAAGAARLRDLDVLVARIAADGCERSERSVSQWDETRVWDPGD